MTAVGVFAAADLMGPIAMVAAYLTMSMFAVTVVWGLSLEIGLDRASVVRCGLYSSLAVFVAVGLAQLHPHYGPLVGLAVGLTSPQILGFLDKVRLRMRKRRVQAVPQRAAGVLVDNAMLDRRFDEIVSHLKESGDFPER